MRALAAPLLLRAATAWQQPVAGAAALVQETLPTGSVLFASGRLSLWHSFSSQHGVVALGSTGPSAVASSGISMLDTLRGPMPAQRMFSTTARQGAATAALTERVQYALQEPDDREPRRFRSISGSSASASASARAPAAAAAPALPPRAGVQPGRRRANWRLDHSIGWTPKLAADAQQFWREQGVTRAIQLKRLARWTEMSPLFRNLPQLAQRMAAWREAANRLGRPEEEALRLVLSERTIIEKGADPNRIIGNMLAIQQAFAAHGLSSHGLLRSRVLQNKTDTIVERIPMFVESMKSWPVKVDYAAMLERNPGLLASHSTNFAVYTERVEALARWAPPTLDLSQFLVRAPTLLNLLPALVQQRYAALQELLQLDDEQMVQFIIFSPGLLSRRPATNAWKIAYHRAYAEHRAAAGCGDELDALYTPQQFPSRLCNLLLQSADRVQRLRYLVERHAGEADMLARTGYSWVRLSPGAWRKLCPDFPEWLQLQPLDPADTRAEDAAMASGSSSSEDDADGLS